MDIQILINILEGIWLVLWAMANIAIKVYPIEITIAVTIILIAWLIKRSRRRW